MKSNRTRHSVQVDHSDHCTTHVVATGVPPPPTDSPILDPPPRPHKGSVEGHAEQPQGVDDGPGRPMPTGPMLEQLTAPTPGVCHVLHRASAPTEQLGDEVLDLAMEPLRVLYLQGDIPPAGTSNRPGRLGLQRRVEAAHPGGVVEQWLTLNNPSTAQGQWYLHQLLFLPRTAPERRWQTRTTHGWSAWARRASRSRPCLPSGRDRAQRRCSRAPCSTRSPQCSKGGAVARTGLSRTE